MINPSTEAEKRLASAANIWLASVRADGRPHLAPLWFAWYDGKLYACIQSSSVKARNLQKNARISLALEDGASPIICEGTAATVSPPWPPAVAAVFKAKYDWDITTDGEYDQLLEITPAKWLSW